MPPKNQMEIRPLPALALGQAHADAFLKAVDRRTVPSLLFSGPEGSGKLYSAVNFARELCCENKKPCSLNDDVCDSCGRARRLEHPGIHLIFPTPTQGSGEGEDGDVGDISKVLEETRHNIFAKYRFAKKASIRIARARAIIQRANTKPFDSPLNIFILVDAHAMREEAQNALLKLVEEPLPHSVFIFLTTNPEGILYTIRSRCQALRFSPLKTTVVESVLINYFGISETDAHRAASLAHGSINRACDLSESSDDSGRNAAAAFVAGLTVESDSWALGQAMVVGKGNNREGVARFLNEVSIVFRDIMVGDPSLYINAQLTDGIKQMAGAWNRAILPASIDRIAQARSQILISNSNIDSTLAELFLHLRRSR